MSKNKIQATILESNDGAFYKVLLNAVPKQGEKISLYSHLDQSKGHSAVHKYEVISVTHEIHDVAEGIGGSESGYHEVIILVMRR